MEANQPSKFKSALNHGAMLGLVLMLISLIIYVFELYEANQWMSWISMIVLIAGIVMGVKNYRDKVSGGFISYGSAISYGVYMAFFAGIVSAFVTYIYLGYVDDGFIEYSLMQQEDEMYNQGLPDEQIEVAMEWTRKFMAPGALAVMGVFFNTLFGLIISLIAGAFLKNEPENFEDTP